jgi:hypothetical protein
VEAVKLGRFRISLEGLGLAVLGLALVLSVGRCNAMRDGRDAERLAQLERNAYKSSLSAIHARAVTDSVTKVTDSVTREMTNQVAANRRLSARLSATLAVNDSILSLPPDSVGEGVALDQLARTSEVARLYRDSTEVILTAIADLVSAYEAERQAWLAEREYNAKAIALERQVSEHLRKQARCRVLGVPCPTRVQSGMVGAGIVLLLTLL